MRRIWQYRGKAEIRQRPKPTTMEKIALGFSGISMIISIGIPIFGYYFLQNEIRQQQIRSQSLRAGGDCSNHVCSVNISNGGELPIKDVRVSMRIDLARSDNIEAIRVRSEPPQRIDIDDRTRDIVIYFVDAFPPKQNIWLDVAGFIDRQPYDKLRAPQAWFTSEAGPDTPILWATAR